MMNYLKIAFGVLIALSASRFIPHPPNFTSLLALSFYIPAVFGKKYIPVVVIALLFTDLFLGFHSTILFTSGSVILIGFDFCTCCCLEQGGSESCKEWNQKHFLDSLNKPFG